MESKSKLFRGPIVVALIALAFVLWIERDSLWQVPVAAIAPDSRPAFEQWLEAEPERQEELAALDAFLREQDVGGVVPTWQLTRIDAFYAGRCELESFTMPPRDLWANVVPALRLVRDEVIPAVGAVEVRSSYRTPELNRCARGAGRSKHLQFSALDLVSADGRRGEDLYRDLCAMYESAGPASRMGLGAYYDFADTGFGGGRFHIDGEGYRTWGRGYAAGSSPCGRFN